MDRGPEPCGHENKGNCEHPKAGPNRKCPMTLKWDCYWFKPIRNVIRKEDTK